MLDQKYEDGGDAEFNRRGLRVAGSADVGVSKDDCEDNDNT